jgi:hypothetical protein
MSETKAGVSFAVNPGCRFAQSGLRSLVLRKIASLISPPCDEKQQDDEDENESKDNRKPKQ